MDRELLGERIHDFRELAGYTQEGLASTSGVAKRAIQRLEAGVANPTLGTLEALAVAMNRRLEELFGIPVDILTIAERAPSDVIVGLAKLGPGQWDDVRNSLSDKGSKRGRSNPKKKTKKQSP